MKRGPAAVAPAAPPAESRAPRVLWVTACTLVVLRAVLAFVPTMHAWSLNLQRFLAPPAAWLPWTLALLALIPALARRATPACSRLGSWIMDARVLGPASCMVCGAALVWLLPDRTWYVGDFLLRQDTLEAAVSAAAWYPQALPLDLFLHDTVPRALMAGLTLDPNGAGRLIGVVEAALLAGLAIHFARVLGLRGAAAIACAAVIFFGGALTLFTGYNKAFSELCLLVAAVGAFGLAAVRDGRGLLAMGLALSASFTLHRAAVGLLPFAAVVWVLWLRSPASRGGVRRPAVWAAAGVPLIVLGVMLPRVIAIVSGFDPRHFAPEGAAGPGAGARALDFANLLVMLVPLGIALPPLVAALGAARARSREALTLGALAIPLVATALFIHPGQGLARDWDVFAPFGMAVSIVAAWAVGETLRDVPRWAWLGLTVALAVAVPGVQWLLHEADPARGRARIEAIATEPPPRTRAERYSNWQYLGLRLYREERWAAAAEAYANAAAAVPSPHILRQWAGAESQAGHYEQARALFRRLVAGDPNDGIAWLGLAVASYRLGDDGETRRAGREVMRLDPGNEEVREVLQMLDRTQGTDDVAPATPGR